MVDVTDMESGILEEEGWTRRSILDEPRLSEVVDTYCSLGFEVKKVPLEFGSIGKGCAVCLEARGTGYWAVYTRAGEKVTSDLFD